MKEQNISDDITLFLNKLKELGGGSGNRALRGALNWDETKYWSVQRELIADGRIIAGRGKGGSVAVVELEPIGPEISGEELVEEPRPSRETDLYIPIISQLESRWVQSQGYRRSKIIDTHGPGRKFTGGTFTRPDITCIGESVFTHIGKKQIEVTTFEVKTKDSITVIGILEALAHREQAHFSYVIYQASKEIFEDAKESDRIVELASKHGIGIILADQPHDYGTWEPSYLDAVAHQPNLRSLDRFIGLLSIRDIVREWVI